LILFKLVLMVIYIVYAKGENMTVFINVPVTVEINKLLEGSQNIKYRKWYLLLVNLNTSFNIVSLLLIF
jgi:hypothetical protein